MLLVILLFVFYNYQHIIHKNGHRRYVITSKIDYYHSSSETNHANQEAKPKEIVMYTENHNSTSQQQLLFDELMRHVYSLQSNISSTNSVIIYKSHGESGLGNIIVGMVSSLIAAVATNRGFQSIFL